MLKKQRLRLVTHLTGNKQPIENYGKKEQKDWLDNILPDPRPCTAGNKEEETVPDPHPCRAGNKEEQHNINQYKRIFCNHVGFCHLSPRSICVAT